jgi:hypothetical protein
MTIHIAKPRLLLLLLGIMAFGAIVYTVVADDSTSGPQPTGIPVGNDQLPQATEEEVATARETLMANATFASLTAGRSWTVIAQMPNTDGGVKVGVALIVELDAPSTSNGPWLELRCQATISREFLFEYRGITQVGAAFGPDGRSLVALRPLPSGSLTFDEADVERQPPLQPCPKGSEDVEN